MNIKEVIKKAMKEHFISPDTLDETAERAAEQAVEELGFTDVTTPITAVNEFHEKFGHEVGNVNTVNDTLEDWETPAVRSTFNKMMLRRLNNMLEELEELSEACGTKVHSEFLNIMAHYATAAKFKHRHIFDPGIKHTPPSLVDMVKELTDIEYYLSGTVVCIGMHKIFYHAFHATHKNNMLKVIHNYKLAEDTIEAYAEKGVTAEIITKTDPSDSTKHYHIIQCLDDERGIFPEGKILKPLGAKKTAMADVFDQIYGKGLLLDYAKHAGKIAGDKEE